MIEWYWPVLVMVLLAGTVIGIYAERINQKKKKEAEEAENTWIDEFRITWLNKRLDDRKSYYLIKEIKEIGSLYGKKYFKITVVRYNLDKKEIYTDEEEIHLTLPERNIEIPENISVVEVGMLGFNNTGLLKISRNPHSE